MRVFCSVAAFMLVFSTAAVAAEDAGRPAKQAAEQEAEEGFAPLFDGKTLDGWQGATDGYAVEDGVLKSRPESGGKLFTKDEYADFIFRFEFRLHPGDNNGIGIRTPTDCNPAYCGMEIQILDDAAERYADLRPEQYHGSIYGVVAAKRGHLKPVGEWNCEEISCKGRHVKVTVNGAVVVDANLDEIGDKTPDGHAHPGLKRDKGHIGLLGHRTAVEFRNLRVKRL